MATVTLSNGLLSSFYYRLTDFSDSSNEAPYNLHHYSSTTNFSSRLKLMSGTIPADFSTLTAANSLSDQVLWSHTLLDFEEWVTETANFGGSSLRNKALLNMNNYVQATQTGTAEWFWYSVPTGTSSDASIYFQFIGSVGTSGTDLILPTTSITSGKNYRIRGLELQIAQDYTY